MLHGVDEQTQVAATKKEQEQKFNFINISTVPHVFDQMMITSSINTKKKKKNTVDLPYATASRTRPLIQVPNVS